MAVLDDDVRIESSKLTDEDMICPVCSSSVRHGFGTRLGKILVCINYPNCNYMKKNEDRIVSSKFDVKKPY